MLRQQTIPSPVDPNSLAEKIFSIPVHTIISLYRKDTGIDVSEYFEEKSISVYQCSSTGYRFYYPYSIAGKESLYESLQKKEAYYSDEKWEYSSAKKEISHGSIVDIGCGEGIFLDQISHKCNYTVGIELNENAVKKGLQKNRNIIHTSLDEFANDNLERFDYVTLFQVLEHIPDVYSFLSKCLTVLKPGGRIIIGVPNNDPYLYKFDKYHTLNLPPHHMGLWTTDNFKKWSGVLNLHIISILTDEANAFYRKNLINGILRTLSIEDHWMNIFCGKVAKKVFKPIAFAATPFLNGRNILAVLQK